jgi:hypothetical protein
MCYGKPIIKIFNFQYNTLFASEGWVSWKDSSFFINLEKRHPGEVAAYAVFVGNEKQKKKFNELVERRKARARKMLKRFSP